MKLAQVGDVELISIKTKSLEDLDNEIPSNLKTSQFNKLNANKSFGTQWFSTKSGDFSNDFTEEKTEEENTEDFYESCVRYVAINKSPNGVCGFHLTRTKWDPYPWVSAVDNFTPAAKSGLKPGDCILEVNGCDILGLRITEIAKLVKSSQHQVTLLLWSPNCNAKCNKESLCAAPMPLSLQRLSLVVQTVLSLIECPVCLDTITPPAMQCQNGHLQCVNCRIRAEKCPVCRERYFPRPALIAEQIHSAITSAFNLCRNEDKVRQKIFGRHNRQRQMVKATLDCLEQKQKQLQQHHQAHKFVTTATQTEDIKTTITTNITAPCIATINRKCDIKITDKLFKCARNCSNGNRIACNKFLTKCLNSKAYSMENLTNGHNNTTKATTDNIFNTCHTTITSTKSQLELLEIQQRSLYQNVGEHGALFKEFAPSQQQQQQHQRQTLSVTNTNQFNNLPRNATRNHHYLLTYKPNENDLNINSKLCCKQMLNNKTNHFSLLSDRDLTRTKESITCSFESSRIFMNDTNKTPWPPLVCETSYATIPRAIKLKEKHYKQQILCQNDEHEDEKATTNFLKSANSSISSLNLSLSISSSTTPSSACCYKCSSLASASEIQNCQS